MINIVNSWAYRVLVQGIDSRRQKGRRVIIIILIIIIKTLFNEDAYN